MTVWCFLRQPSTSANQYLSINVYGRLNGHSFAQFVGEWSLSICRIRVLFPYNLLFATERHMFSMSDIVYVTDRIALFTPLRSTVEWNVPVSGFDKARAGLSHLVLSLLVIATTIQNALINRAGNFFSAVG